MSGPLRSFVTVFFSLPFLKPSMDPNSAPRSLLLEGGGVGRGEGGAAPDGGGGAGGRKKQHEEVSESMTLLARTFPNLLGQKLSKRISLL